MSFLAHLWIPILLSAVVLFVLSAASHMALPWRRNEWGRITEFEALQASLKGLRPGLYAFPAAPTPKEQMTKEWRERWAKGPSGWLTIAPGEPIRMGRNMAQSVVAYALVAALAAYVAWHALGTAAPGRAVFRLVGTLGFMSLGVGTVFESIWYHRPWRAYASDVIDALLAGLALAAVFAWLWPR